MELVSQKYKLMLNAFERKVLRKVCRPVLDKGQCRNRYNNENCNLYKKMELIRIVE
jgi:hypothetical protein